mmetsp:Transcript_65374/g.156305  ORF Transcript_65374/g.156305 Transcript_65374/m.156305 type:complete len:390 (+) Transcript_65374:92-1261(+)
MGCTHGCEASHNASSAFHQKYKLGNKIGKGGFAQVRIARNVKSNEQVAVKILNMKAEMASVEMRFLKMCQNQHCVRLLEAHIEKDLSYLVMELCDATLFATFDKMKVLTEHAVVPFVIGMLKSLIHIHSMGIVHRDVKPENFLCVGPQCIVKLCDFGVAASVSHHDDESLYGVSGTAAFVSPEMVSGKKYGAKTDVWSLGVLMYALFFGHLPYESKNGTSAGLKQAIRSGSSPPSFSLPLQLRQSGAVSVSQQAQDFVRALLVREAKWRLTAVAAIDSPYLGKASPGKNPGAPSLRPMLHAVLRTDAIKAVEETSFETEFVDRRLRNLQAAQFSSFDSSRPTTASSTSAVSTTAPVSSKRTSSVGSRGLGESSSPRSANTNSYEHFRAA